MPAALRGQAEDAGDGWSYVSDHRKVKVYCTRTCREMVVKHLGALPDTVTAEKPPAQSGYAFKDGKWEMRPEPEAPRDLAAELDALKAVNADLLARLQKIKAERS